MIIWINGAFGSGKTTAAFELHRRLRGSFVYDPENVGYFIRKNAPESFSHGDFQDIPLWREMNYELLKLIAQTHDGDIIVPMTLVNSDYHAEIVGRLVADGFELRHFILYASREELRRRLRKRLATIFRGDTFALGSIERCVTAFDTTITEEKLQTDTMSVDEVVEELAARCGLTLLPDRRTRLGRWLHRTRVLIQHIRT